MLSTCFAALLLALVPAALAQNTVTCGDVSLGEVSITGALKLFSAGSGGLPIPSSGANVSYVPEEIVYGSTFQPGYTFKSCNSSFMGYHTQVYKGSGAVAYGQLLTPQGAALTVNYTAGRGPYHIRAAAPSTSDDSSQLLQYWLLTSTSNGLELDFHGEMADGTSGTGVNGLAFGYFLSQQVEEDGQPILIDTYSPPGPAPIYSLRLIPQ